MRGSANLLPNANAINNIGFIGRRWVFIDHLDAAGAEGEFKSDTAGDIRSMDHALVLQEYCNACEPEHNIIKICIIL